MRELSIKYFDQMYAIMKASFPRAEKRDYEGQKALFERSDYHVIGNVKNDILQAFITCYMTDEFCFIEHFATQEYARGKGVGKELLRKCFHNCKKPVIFEVEPPTTPIARRRIAFYQRQGCHLYPHIPYTQPSFHEGEPELPLLLMSWPVKYSKETMQKYIKVLYKEIYHV